MNKIKIIYILGSGHSGSTLLDVYLGSAKGGESLGEIIWINDWIHKIDKRRCPCGKRINQCEFWGPALRNWLNEIGDDGLAEYKQLQPKFEIPSSPSLYMLSRHKSIKDTRFPRYAELTYLLFKNMQAVNNAQYIVDSSKFPSRAFALLNNPYLDVFFIHLIKDPRAVTYSAIKRKKRTDLPPNWKRPAGTLRESIGWLMHNKQCDIITNDAGKERSFRVRYHDFVLHPEKTLSLIAEKANIQISDLIITAKNNQPVTRKHPVAGNRILFQESIQLRPDFSWKEKIPRIDKLLSWAIAGKQATNYGFRWHEKSNGD